MELGLVRYIGGEKFGTYNWTWQMENSEKFVEFEGLCGSSSSDVNNIFCFGNETVLGTKTPPQRN